MVMDEVAKLNLGLCFSTVGGSRTKGGGLGEGRGRKMHSGDTGLTEWHSFLIRVTLEKRRQPYCIFSDDGGA